MSVLQPILSAQEYERIKERDELAAAGVGVTVVIPCYNQVDYLRDALDSVWAQTVQPLEVIVIDDGSDYPISWSDSRLRVVRVTNRGLPSARNVGLMLAKGDAFLPLDADDWLDPQYIEKTLPLLADADVVLTGLQEHGPPPRNQAYKPGYDRPWAQVTRELLLHDYNRFFYCSLFRTSLLREVGGYNGRMIHGYEDWDMWIDLLGRGVRFAAVDDPLFNYRTRADSMWSSAERMRAEIVAEIHRHHR